MKKVELKSDMVIYQREDGTHGINVRIENETVWLTIEQMAELFEKSRSTINEHILNIYKEKELIEGLTIQKIGNSDFLKKPTNFYNLDVIISVGYRVKSVQGTRFRQWATTRLREYIIKGFTMDDDRLKDLGKRFYGTQYIYRIKAHVERCDSSEKLSQSKRITCIRANSFWVSRLCRASSGKRSSDEDE